MRHYRKHCEEPFLSYMLEGIKIVEGRVCRGEWAILEIGDIISFYNDIHEASFKITKISYAKNFGVLFDMFGEHLLPGVKNVDEAMFIYSKWFKNSSIENFGVIGISVERFGS